jgi:hypothetical protein
MAALAWPNDQHADRHSWAAMASLLDRTLRPGETGS